MVSDYLYGLYVHPVCIYVREFSSKYNVATAGNLYVYKDKYLQVTP